MDRTTRITISALFAATALSGLIAVVLRSELAAIATAVFVSTAVYLAMGARDVASATAASARTNYAPTSSATVDVMEVATPAPPEWADLNTSGHPPTSTPVGSVIEGGAQTAKPTPSRPGQATGLVFSPKLPPGSEPREVISSLLVAARAAGRPIAAHLWLEDPATDTLRLVEAQGEARPSEVPVALGAGLLGASLTEGTAHLGPIETPAGEAGRLPRWRYAVPLTGSDLRGVAAIDFEGSTGPDRAVLTTISATLRASLSGALALHVARNEAETARALVETCAELSRVLDPADVLHTALDRAMELADAQTGSIMILDQETRRMRIAASRGLPEEIVTETDISEGDGIAGWVLASRQPLVIEDLKLSGVRSQRHGVRSAVCVPLADERGIVGVLNVGCTSFHARFSKSHLEMLDALGRTVVVALRNAWASDGAQDLYFATLKALAIALESRDPYSRGATERVVEVADALAAYFGMPSEETKALRVAAMLHDVGMSAAGTVVPVSDEPLSTVEWGMLKMHPVIAAEIMSQAPALSDVIPIVYHHHEHFDGSGYVGGLSGADIPLGARILAVVDAYVAMTSERPYRAALTHVQAVGELERLAGSQFDPRVVRGIIAVLGGDERQGLLGN